MSEEKKILNENVEVSKQDNKTDNLKILHTFAHGFGTISLLVTISYTESAHAGSFAIGPCGVHYT